MKCDKQCGVSCQQFIDGKCEQPGELLDFAEDEILHKYNKVRVTYNDYGVASEGVIMFYGKVDTGQLMGEPVIVDRDRFIRFWRRYAGRKVNPVWSFKKWFVIRLVERDGGVVITDLFGVSVSRFEEAMKGWTLDALAGELRSGLSGGFVENVESRLGHEAGVVFGYLGANVTEWMLERSLG